ncbi:MAG: putative DNA primase/helicase [Paracoccaceae bacterium]|jgi:putative DNA primase/helicase
MISADKIAVSLGGRQSGSGWIAPCPSHDDRTPSLSLDDCDDGRVLVHCHAGCEQESVIKALKSLGLWLGEDDCSRPSIHFGQRKHLQPARQPDRKKAAQALWENARPAADTIVERYLRGRGIYIDPPPCLRFVASARHAPSSQSLPCIVASVEAPGGGVVAVQRTFLAPDGRGKAPVDPAKMALGPIAGGAVRLAEAHDLLGLCEGIEDGLSVMQAEPLLPVWATLGTSGLRAVVLPDSVRQVVILADGDPAGEASAQIAARRFRVEGRSVRIARPPSPFKDFNAALQGVVIAEVAT